MWHNTEQWNGYATQIPRIICHLFGKVNLVPNVKQKINKYIYLANLLLIANKIQIS